ncbi:hypothetical protein SJ05684_b51030 (plasmid) [Sinorhizobium sojae CCBAU 05684]|uniref:Uncharacterized protein n=1 Tax=Sinorhizobium sojae CCBAU 05684 TaxID=716928 RepID=A0A249PK44_9HYPH|nr:hypothetical protein SJ05684_b51030 [Sinorhizobium sojae CCBAU 05684]
MASRASRRAIALPIPDPAPVTSATRFDDGAFTGNSFSDRLCVRAADY